MGGKTRFSKWQLIAMVSLPIAVILNPLTINIYLDKVVLVLEGVSFVAGAYFVAFALVKMLMPERPRLPKVGGKSHGKDGMKFVATKAARA